MSNGNFLLNAGMGLGGGLGSMPVALPFSLGGAAPGVAFQGGDMGAAGMGAMGGAAGVYGSALSPEMQSQMMPMGMTNRDGQQFMGQEQPQTQTPENGMSQMDKMKLMNMAMQGFNKGQQGMPSGNTAQIIRDSNRFSYAQNPQQQMAMALRQRG